AFGLGDQRQARPALLVGGFGDRADLVGSGTPGVEFLERQFAGFAPCHDALLLSESLDASGANEILHWKFFFCSRFSFRRAAGETSPPARPRTARLRREPG